jgi:hypothetical protein
MTHPSPPTLGRWLLQRLARAEDAPYLDADLAEAFDERCAAIGPRAARRWYWTQVAASAVPLIAVRFAPARAALDTSTGDPMWHNVRADLHYAYRLGRRAWLSTLAVILTMTLGIGATTAVFSVVNALLLRPLPFADQDRVVRVGGVVPTGNEIVDLAHPDLLDYRTGAPRWLS